MEKTLKEILEELQPNGHVLMHIVMRYDRRKDEPLYLFEEKEYASTITGKVKDMLKAAEEKNLIPDFGAGKLIEEEALMNLEPEKVLISVNEPQLIYIRVNKNPNPDETLDANMEELEKDPDVYTETEIDRWTMHYLKTGEIFMKG